MYNVQTRETERLNYSSEIETRRNILTPNIGIFVVILVGAMLWLVLGGVTLDTTFAINLVIKVPAWLMFLGGLAFIVVTVFVARYLRDEYV